MLCFSDDCHQRVVSTVQKSVCELCLFIDLTSTYSRNYSSVAALVFVVSEPLSDACHLQTAYCGSQGRKSLISEALLGIPWANHRELRRGHPDCSLCFEYTETGLDL